ncbi:MAG: alpha-glucosidase/alpha-galactosidase [Thermomicrobiales bacterium]|nr:alpha-glucosidase/alpha-galactosidase [Thermomicrobiales bacterium]
MGSPRIALVGAGSSVFARALIRDTYTFPALRDADLRLMDPDPARLADTAAIANRLRAEYDGTGAITAHRELGPAIDQADFVITMFQVGGYEPATVTDFEIPRTYGLRQTIGDTLGIGGIMRALRSIPVLNDIAAQMEQSCPDALLLNYVNPMAPLVWAASAATSIRTVGLCHSVQGTAAELASFLDVPAEEIGYDCAGINHMAFYTRFERNGTDLYPALRELEASKTYPAWEAPRFTLMRDFGYFVTESSEHLSEYVPWLIKDGRPDLIDRYNIPLDEYPARCVDQIADWSSMRSALLSDDPEALSAYQQANGETLSGNWERKLARERLRDSASEHRLRTRLLEERYAHQTGHSGEYGTLIIHSLTTGEPSVIWGNVPNAGLIDNLPSDCVVEVACTVDASGFQPQPYGALPPQLASLITTNINPQRMMVHAALHHCRQSVYQAALLDPHTAAELDPEQIHAMVDELISAHGNLIPELA